MTTLDRTIRRVQGDFAPMEGLVAVVLGLEHLESGGPGRRRIVAVATDQRVMLAHLRPTATVSLPYASLQAVEVAPRGDHHDLVLVTTAGAVHRLDEIRDERALATFVELVRARRWSPDRRASTSVRLVDPFPTG